MEFNKENYEEYALDYLEDMMSPEDRLQFESFLWKNPHIKAEFDDFQLIYLPEPNFLEKFPNKEGLIRPVAVTIPLQARNNRRAWKKWSVAASILLLLGLTYYTTTNDRNVSDDLVGVPPSSIQKDVPSDQKESIDSEEVLDEDIVATLNSQEKLVVPEKTIDKNVGDPKKETSSITKDLQAKENRKSSNDLAMVEPIETIDDKILIAEPEEDLNFDISRDVRPIRDVVLISALPQRQMTPNLFETEDRELTMPILIIDEETDEKFRLGKFLAKANLLPRSFGDIVGVGFKEKLVPESFQEIKETR